MTEHFQPPRDGVTPLQELWPPSHPAQAAGLSPASTPNPESGSPPLSLFEKVEPKPEMAVKFFRALFGEPRGQIVHIRAKLEAGGQHGAKNLHYPYNENFERTIASVLEYCSVEGRAAYFLPGFVKPNGTTKEDVLTLTSVLADFDKGVPAENLAAAEALIGPASIVVESGGTTDDGHSKIHAYWCIRETDWDKISLICEARLALALKFGGDQSFRQEAQVSRVGGSLHFKGNPKLARLCDVRSHVYALADIAGKLSITDKKPTSIPEYDYDFSGDRPKASVDDLRDMYVKTEGQSKITRWEWFSRVAGAEITDVRFHRKTHEDALAYMRGKVAGNLERPEDWDDARVEHEYWALVRVDEGKYGRIIPLPTQTQASDWQLSDWNARRFRGTPPERQWLVEGLIPAGVQGLMAAVGDAGKSLMALRLALVVGCHPPCATTKDSPAGINDTPNFFGRPITARGTAIVLTAEDDGDEVHRRLHSLDPTALRLREEARLIVLPLLSIGGPRAIMTDGREGPQFTPFWADLRTKLLAVPDLALVVLDPLSSFMLADTNDNTAGAAMMTELGKLGAETGATFLLVHHFNKGGNITGLSDARTAIRGAGSLVDNGRFALALWEADGDAAYSTLKLLGRAPPGPVPAGVVYFGGLTKGNAPGEKTLRTLVRNQSTGLLEDVTDALRTAAPKQDEMDAAVYRALCTYTEEDPRFAFGCSERTLEKMWQPALKAANLTLARAKLEDTFQRLKMQKLIAATLTRRGNHILYQVVRL